MEDGLDPAQVVRVSKALQSCSADRSLCSTAAHLVGVSGAGIVLVSGGRPLGSVCTSDPTTETVEDAQFTLGEGPCVDAFRTGKPTVAPDLAAIDETRWPGFREDALAAGIRAAFGFPLVVGPACIGALNLYNRETGSLTDDQFGEAEVVAHAAARIVLSWQTVAGPGSLAWQLEQIPEHRAAVHQATGMVSVQAAVTVRDALALLRAFAFAEGLSIGAVSNDVVAGRLRF
jgi:transcriptional regulator with GAF, ATPase, and Fis domain